MIPYNNNFTHTLTYEVSLSKLEYRRTLYNMLDFMRDIGGLAAAFRGICFGLVYIFQLHGPEMFVMSSIIATPG